MRSTILTATATAMVGFMAACQPGPPPSTVLVSADVSGLEANGASGAPAVSGNARYVAFQSDASDLVPDDGNGVADVFVRDIATGVTVRASTDTAGGDANSGSFLPSISTNGRYVAFQSDASDLVPADGNGTLDVFVRDLVTGTTIRASVDVTGGNANAASYVASISGDGRHVSFLSYASDLVAGDDGIDGDSFVRDLVARTTTRVTVTPEGGEPSTEQSNPAGGATDLSGDGHLVAFDSFAVDLVPGVDPNGGLVRDVFVRDLTAGVTTRVSGDLGGYGPSISADGRYVSFTVGSPPDQVYVHDLITGTTTLASASLTGAPGNGQSGYRSEISANGRYLTFDSSASDLVTGDDNSDFDVFVRDLVRDVTIRASVDAEGDDPNAPSREPAISGNGLTAAFNSTASDIVAGDGPFSLDVFARRLETAR